MFKLFPFYISLFFPSSLFHQYFVVLFCSIAFSAAFLHRRPFNHYSLPTFSIFVIFFYYLFVLIRQFQFQTDNFRDLIEGFRYFPLLILFIFKNKFQGVEMCNFISALGYFVTFDFYISFSQFFDLQLPFSDIVASLYNSSFHTDNSLAIAHRTLGLGSGPGDHGVSIAACFIIIFNSISEKYSVNKITLLCMAAFSIFSSQSQTAFIGISIFLFIFYGTRIYLKPSKKLLFGFFCTLTVGFIIVFLALSNFNYLFSLFEQGLSRSSYINRVIKRDRLVSEAMKNPAFLTIGWGKEYFGADSGAMDNEYLYVLLVYGLPGIALLIWFMLLSLRNLLSNSFVLRTWGHLFLFGAISAWPASFFLAPQTMYLLAFFYTYFLRITSPLSNAAFLGALNESYQPHIAKY